MERQMTEAVTISNEELAILCDIVAGWSVKKAESLDRGNSRLMDAPLQNTSTPPKPICFSPNSASLLPGRSIAWAPAATT
jgi:hypothetical protein